MSKLHPKYAHSPGRTNLCYSIDGRYLFSVGADRLIRKFTVGSTDEPDTIDHHEGDILAIATSKYNFATCSEDGTVSLFDLKTNEYKGLVTRSALPIRELCFSNDGEYIAVGGDDSLAIKVVEIENIMNVSEIAIGPAAKGIKHVSYDKSGKYLAASCGDGNIRVYNVSANEHEHDKSTPEMELKNVIPQLKSLGEETSTKVAWHPSSKYFCVPTKDATIAIYSLASREQIVVLKDTDEQQGLLNDLQWSPNGRYICSCGPGGQLTIWDVKTHSVIQKHTVSSTILFVDWHMFANVLSFTTDQGQLFTLTAAVPLDHDLPYGQQLFVNISAHKDTSGRNGNDYDGYNDEDEIDAPTAKTHPHLDQEADEGDDDDEEEEEEEEEENDNADQQDEEEDQNEKEEQEEEDIVDDAEMDGDLEDELDRYHSNRLVPPADVFGQEDADADAEGDLGEENWIEDDDGAGYVEDSAKRHIRSAAGVSGGLAAKRLKVDGDFQKMSKVVDAFFNIRRESHQKSFQSGSTPWTGDRRYLCMNFIGYIWTVSQSEDHNSITVSFFDRDLHREYHFNDNDKFDLACISEEACLFATSKSNKVRLRFHDGYNDNWEYFADEDDTIRSISLSETLVVVVTGKGYVQTFNIYGTPLRLYRQSRNPAITCASWKDLFMIVRLNKDDGSLNYTIEDGKSNINYQKDDYLDIADGQKLSAAFFSESGDPCIFDSEGVLLVLLHWRTPGQARWVPIMSSKQLSKSQGREERYWPLGLSDDGKFHCVILKGADKYPPIPLPVTSEFDLSVPFSTTESIEQQFLTQSVLYDLLKDRVNAEGEVGGFAGLLSRKELELDKVILRLLQASCREGKLSKSVGLVALLKKEQALEAARKIADRLDMSVLIDKIEEIREQRVNLLKA